MPNVKLFFRFLLFLILSLLLLFLDKKGWLDFLKRPVEKLTNPIKLFFFQKRASYDQNQEDKILTLERKIAEFNILQKNLEEENKACRRLLQAPLPASMKFLPSRVLAFSEHKFLIDKGRDQGLREGKVVILDNVFLGRINQVNPQNSWVETPFDFKIKARTFKTKAQGVVVEKNDRLFLKEVLQKEVLEKDDLVIVFGEENIPRDLVIARIKEVNKQPSEVYQEAEIVPTVDYEKLGEVFVIL